MLVTLLGNEFHNETVLGTKECKKEFVCAKGSLEPVLLWRGTKIGGRKNDKIMYNFEHGI